MENKDFFLKGLVFERRLGFSAQLNSSAQSSPGSSKASSPDSPSRHPPQVPDTAQHLHPEPWPSLVTPVVHGSQWLGLHQDPECSQPTGPSPITSDSPPTQILHLLFRSGCVNPPDFVLYASSSIPSFTPKLRLRPDACSAHSPALNPPKPYPTFRFQPDPYFPYSSPIFPAHHQTQN